MSIAFILILLAAICFGIAAFARTVNYPRLVAAGLFLLSVTALLKNGLPVLN